MSRRFLGIGIRRGVRTGSGGSSPPPSLDDLVASIINSYGTQAQRAWFRADGYTVDGVTGKVGAFVDRLDASHLLAQASSTRQVAVPSADAALANAPSATFSAHWYDSSRAASSWRPYHDGTGCTVINVYVPTTFATANSILMATYVTGSDVGFEVRRSNTSNARAIVRGASGQLFNLQGGTMTTGVGHRSTYQYMTGRSPNEGTLTLDGTQVAQANSASTPSSGDPAATLRLGARADGSVPWLGRWAESMLIPGIISSGEVATIQSYFLQRYGLGA